VLCATDIHDTVSKLVPKILEFNPSVIIAIGGGGFIPDGTQYTNFGRLSGTLLRFDQQGPIHREKNPML
jgi:alcohol dehydrogenase class IV